MARDVGKLGDFLIDVREVARLLGTLKSRGLVEIVDTEFGEECRYVPLGETLTEAAAIRRLLESRSAPIQIAIGAFSPYLDSEAESLVDAEDFKSEEEIGRFEKLTQSIELERLMRKVRGLKEAEGTQAAEDYIKAAFGDEKLQRVLDAWYSHFW